MPFAIWIHKEELLADGQWWKLLIGIIDGDGYDTPISFYDCLPCWFIVSIIQLRILFLLVEINKISAAILVLISVVFLVIRKHLGLDLFFCIDSTVMAIPYFLIGYFMKKKLIIESIKRQSIWVVVAFLSALIVSLVLVLNGPAQMNGPSYGHNVIANYIAGISGSILVFSLSHLLANKLGEKKEIKLVSRNTLFIIFAHWVVILPLGIIIAKVLSNFNYIIVLTIVAYILSGFVLLIIRKWIELWIEKFPILFGK